MRIGINDFLKFCKLFIPKTDFSLSMKKLYQLFTEYRSADISLVKTQKLCLE